MTDLGQWVEEVGSRGHTAADRTGPGLGTPSHPPRPCRKQVWDGLPRHTPLGTASHMLTGTFQKPKSFAPLITLPWACVPPVENSFSTYNWLILYLSLGSKVRSI